MNTGTFAGFLGRDAELKTVGQSQVANFSVAVSTFKGGEKSTLWVSAALWGERAAKLAPYLTKGSAVTISGDVDVRAYSAKDGAAKAEIVCNVQRVTLQGSRGEGAEQPRQQEQPAPPAAGGDKGEFGDEIPF